MPRHQGDWRRQNCVNSGVGVSTIAISPEKSVVEASVEGVSRPLRTRPYQFATT